MRARTKARASFLLLAAALLGCRDWSSLSASHGVDSALPEAGQEAGPVDGPAPDTRPGRKCSWLGQVTLDPPRELTELNTASQEVEPVLDRDLRTLYFASDRGNGPWRLDIYTATRQGGSLVFGPPKKLAALSTIDSEAHLIFADEGRLAFLASDRGTADPVEYDLFQARRKDATAPLSSSDFVRLDKLSTGNDEWDPHPSADGLRLYFAQATKETGRLVYAERESVDDPFTTVNPVSAEGMGQLTGTNPSLTADELVLVFASYIPGGKGDSDIWYATRAGRTKPFSKPQNVPGVNTVDKEREVFIAPDGCTLIFARTPTGLGTKNYFDLYAASYRGP